MKRIGLIIMVLAMLAAGGAGCGGEAVTKATATVTAPGQVDAITENLLNNISAADYDAYLMSFDTAAGKAWSQEYFLGTSGLVVKKIGKYVAGSKVCTGTTTNAGVTTTLYQADFEEASNIQVTVDTYETGNITYAAGIWFNSSKLFEQ